MYLVVGASGFLGSYLMRAILEQTEEKVLAVSRSSSNGTINARVEWARCDVTHREDMRCLYDRVRHEKIKVLYLAAMHHPDDILKFPLRAWNANIAALADFLGIFESMDAFTMPPRKWCTARQGACRWTNLRLFIRSVGTAN